MNALLSELAELKDEAAFLTTCGEYTFVATYSTELRIMQYDMMYGDDTVRALAEIPPEVMVEFGKFIEQVNAWTLGSERPKFE